jgi:hypothetical protein
METTTYQKASEKQYVPEATLNWEMEFLQELTGLTAEQILNLDFQTLVQLNKILIFYSSI